MRSKWLLTGLTTALLATASGAWWMLRVRAEKALQVELEDARRERAGGRPNIAARRLDRLAATWPGRSDVAFERGLTELARGQTDAALTALARVGPSSPLAGRAAVVRSQVEIQRGRLSAAEALLDEALKTTDRRHPDRPAVRDALVRLLRSEGRFAEARRLFLEGFAEWPEPVAALKMLYRFDMDPFPVEGVRIYLDNAARLAPDDDRAWLGRAHLATRMGRFDEAEQWLDACLKRRATDAAVWRACLDWALAAGRADVVWDALPHVPADRVEVEFLRAWFAARLGNAGEERRALERRLEREPGHVPTINRLAELALAAGSAEEAKRLRARQLEINRATESYRNLLASDDPRSHARELGALADRLGMTFESEQWMALDGSPRLKSGPSAPLRGTLADALSDLRDARQTPDRPHATPGDVTFVDDAEAAGLRFFHDNGASTGPRRPIPPVSASGGVGLLDFDRDGWLDVYCVQGGPFPPDPTTSGEGDRLFRNQHDGTFEDVTVSTGLAAMPRGYGHGVAVGDYDGDGYPDLFVTRWRAYALYRNKGDGTFEDATVNAGLGGDRDWPTSAAFADLDGDGDLDLYVCHYLRWDESDTRSCVDPKNPAKYQCNPLAFQALPDHIFRNDGGRFVDVTAEAGIVDRDGRGFGVVAADLDGDGRVDLYVANDMSANYLFRNLGGLRFEESALASGAAANGDGGYQAGMGVACGDLDGDGRPDLVVTNYYGESTTFFQNLGRHAFADHTAAIGLAAQSRYRLGFGVALPDVNNDGRLDLMTANGHIHDGRPQFPFAMPLQLFLGGERGGLTDVTTRAGAPFAVALIGRGLATGDLDNDGRVDAVVVAQNAPLVYLHNGSVQVGHFLTLELEGRESNRGGVGAEVTIQAGGRRQVAQRVGGGSYQSAGDPRLHFGLGEATVVDALDVRWPSGRVDDFDKLAGDTGYLLREGDPRAAPLNGFKPRDTTASTARKSDQLKEARP